MHVPQKKMTRQEAMKVLGLRQGYTEDEKKKAIRALTRQFHPDVNKTPAAEVIMRKINEASEVLEHCTSVHITHKSLFDIVAE